MHSQSLFGDLNWWELPNAKLALQEDYLPEHRGLYQQLSAELSWSQPQVRLYGKSYPVPRQLAFYGDEGVQYGYSGLRHCAEPWPAALASLRRRLVSDLGQDFNCVLVNWYRSGDDRMGYHSDDEPALGAEPCIASISLGAQRRFLLRPKPGQPGESCAIELCGGSLLVMAGRTQHSWQHALPRQRGAGGRINLTFRKVYE